jgi:hypothetical protein
LRGVDPALEPKVSEIARALREGALTDLQPGAARLLLGHGVAAWLGVGVGDPITLLVPELCLFAALAASMGALGARKRQSHIAKESAFPVAPLDEDSSSSTSADQDISPKDQR